MQNGSEGDGWRVKRWSILLFLGHESGAQVETVVVVPEVGGRPYFRQGIWSRLQKKYNKGQVHRTQGLGEREVLGWVAGRNWV